MSQQITCLEQLILPQPRKVRQGAEEEIVGGKVVCRPAGGTCDFGGLQCRLDHAGDTERHLVLKLKHVFERSVEAVGPQMRAA